LAKDVTGAENTSKGDGFPSRHKIGRNHGAIRANTRERGKVAAAYVVEFGAEQKPRSIAHGSASRGVAIGAENPREQIRDFKRGHDVRGRGLRQGSPHSGRKIVA
jgi:hypothetical protein